MPKRGKGRVLAGGAAEDSGGHGTLYRFGRQLQLVLIRCTLQAGQLVTEELVFGTSSQPKQASQYGRLQRAR